MGAPIAGGLLVQGRFPLDDKYLVDTKANLEVGLVYDGLFRFTKDKQELYIRVSGVWKQVPLDYVPTTDSSGIASLRDFTLTKDGEQTIELTPKASEVFTLLVTEKVSTISTDTRTSVRSLTDYSIVDGNLLLKSDTSVVTGNKITCIYATTGISITPPADYDKKLSEVLTLIKQFNTRLTALENSSGGSGGRDFSWSSSDIFLQ